MASAPKDGAPASTDALQLTVFSPSGERRRVQVDRSPFRIGRLPDRDLTLKDSRISRDHAQILLEDGAYVIEDVGSKHGLFVNGRKVERAALHPRDRIHFGMEDSFQIFVGEAPQASTPLIKKVAGLDALEQTGSLGRLSVILDVARAIESSGAVDDVLAAAVDAALTVTGAERGFLMLKGADEELEIRIARDSEGEPLTPDELNVPRKMIAESLRKRRDLFTMSFDPSLGEDSPAAGRTVVALDLRRVVCVPLVRIRLGREGETSMLNPAADTIGVLYMDSKRVGDDLAKGNQELLQTLAVEISTVLENARLLEEERRKHHLEQELHIAREIQQALLPASLPSEGRLVAAGSSESCFEVGGDYFDVMSLGDESWGVVLADVSGKGVSAALLTALLQGAFFSAAAAEQGLEEAAGRINRYVCERGRHARFATVFWCVIDRDGNCRWINAGHCAGLLARADGSIEKLEPTGCPLGLFDDALFSEQGFVFQPGDRLVLYSDGVSEAADFSKNRLGDERFEEFVARHRALPAPGLHAALLDEINDFTEGAPQSDDLTLLVVGYEG